MLFCPAVLVLGALLVTLLPCISASHFRVSIQTGFYVATPTHSGPCICPLLPLHLVWGPSLLRASRHLPTAKFTLQTAFLCVDRRR